MKAVVPLLLIGLNFYMKTNTGQKGRVKKGRNQRMQKKLNVRNILVKVVKNNHSEH